MANTEREKIYELYQIRWMMSHNVSIRDICQMADEWYKICQEDDINPIVDEGFDFESFLNDRGFGEGSLYVCFDEFFWAEYQDRQYIKELLRSCPELYSWYLDDIKTLNDPA